MTSPDIIQNRFMLTGFIGLEKIALGAKKEELELAAPLKGRPPAYVSPEKKKQAAVDERIRNSIEGKFGQAKRRFSLARVMTKLSHTSETAIAISFLVINLSTWLLRVVWAFLCQFFNKTPFLASEIIKSYLRADFSPQQLIYLTA